MWDKNDYIAGAFWMAEDTNSQTSSPSEVSSKTTYKDVLKIFQNIHADLESLGTFLYCTTTTILLLKL